MSAGAYVVEAFEAIASTLPLGSVAYEKELDAKGECHVWLDRLDRGNSRLAQSHADAILPAGCGARTITSARRTAG
jgi:hypothetical protein